MKLFTVFCFQGWQGIGHGFSKFEKIGPAKTTRKIIIVIVSHPWCKFVWYLIYNTKKAFFMWVINGTKLRLHDQDYRIELKQQHPYDNSPFIFKPKVILDSVLQTVSRKRRCWNVSILEFCTPVSSNSFTVVRQETNKIRTMHA